MKAQDRDATRHCGIPRAALSLRRGIQNEALRTWPWDWSSVEVCGILWEAEPGETRTKTVRSCSNPSSSFQSFSFCTQVWSSWVAETGSELELHSFPEGHLHSLSLVQSLGHSCSLLRRELWLLEALSEQADEGHAGTRAALWAISSVTLYPYCCSSRQEPVSFTGVWISWREAGTSPAYGCCPMRS